jgi:hypothetical protein
MESAPVRNALGYCLRAGRIKWPMYHEQSFVTFTPAWIAA